MPKTQVSCFKEIDVYLSKKVWSTYTDWTKTFSYFRQIFKITYRNASNKSESQTECKKSQKSDVQVCTISECMVDPTKPEPSVVIVGAGIAGLSAAQRLVQCGISNFTILEATDR